MTKIETKIKTLFVNRCLTANVNKNKWRPELRLAVPQKPHTPCMSQDCTGTMLGMSKIIQEFMQEFSNIIGGYFINVSF